jgi:hypothetical protein
VEHALAGGGGALVVLDVVDVGVPVTVTVVVEGAGIVYVLVAHFCVVVPEIV